MSEQLAANGAATGDDRGREQGTQRLSPWLWVALAGAVLQIMGLGSDFYAVPEDGQLETVDAWGGIPHTSDLILLCALIAIGLFILTAAGRSPVRGRSTGLWIGIVGVVTFLQLGYRMLAPPFAFTIQGDQTLANLFSGGCQFYCSFSEASQANAQLLSGIWFSFVGTVLVAVAGLAHAASRAAAASPARPRISGVQPGPSPWLALAAIGSVGAFILGYTIFPFYVTSSMGEAPVAWSGWLPTPHTSSLVLLGAVVTVWLVVLAVRYRSPLGPAALGGAIALIGFIVASRILLRIVQPPFGSGASIELPAYLSLALAVVALLAGVAHAVTHRGTSSSGSPPASTAASR